MKREYNILDIVAQDLCTGCGICVSESPTSLKMQWDEFGFLIPVKIGDNIHDNAIKVCPFNINPDEEVKDEDKLGSIYLKDASQYDPKIGKFENTYIGYSNDYRRVASSGGLATYICKTLLESNIVSHLFIVTEVAGSYQYQLFDSINDITKISKTRYIPVTLEELFLKINDVKGKVAISGVACFIKAIRLKQYYHPELKEKIPFLVGIVCGGLKSKFFTDYLAQKSGIPSVYSKQDYRIKDEYSLSSDYSFGAFDFKNDFHQIKMKQVGDMWGTGLFKNNACDFCTDVLTELADVSLGDAWLDEYRKEGLGNSIVITRSKLADQIIAEGIKNGDLNIAKVGKEKIIESQSSSFTHRQDAIKFRSKIRFLSGKLTPYLRNRKFKKISASYAVVQLQRQRTRAISLKLWKTFHNAHMFEIKIQKELRLLNFFTRVYHRLRK